MIIEIISLILLCVLIALSVILICMLVKANKKPVQEIQIEKIIEQVKQISTTQNELSSSLNNMLMQYIKNSNDTLLNTVSQNNGLQLQQLSDIMNRLNGVMQASDQSMKNAITVIETGLIRLQQDNEKKLEQMRQTVDEKLNVSLENRLTQSFNIINERLQSVYEGIGVMKQLATGVGDLKKVLNNVKTRGTWGEIQLDNLLEQILTKEQLAQLFKITKKKYPYLLPIIKKVITLKQPLNSIVTGSEQEKNSIKRTIRKDF